MWVGAVEAVEVAASSARGVGVGYCASLDDRGDLWRMTRSVTYSAVNTGNQRSKMGQAK